MKDRFRGKAKKQAQAPRDVGASLNVVQRRRLKREIDRLKAAGEPVFTYEEHRDAEGVFFPVTKWKVPGVQEEDVVAILSDCTAEFAAHVVKVLNEAEAA